MFHGFANQWTAIALSTELGATKPLGLMIAGERIALFRDTSGTAHALIDVCPHRGVALSLGTVKDGCITCPFHGWRFDGSGACVKVPWDPDAKRQTLGATPVPLVEQAGLLWLYTAIGSAPAAGPAVPDELMRRDFRHAGFALDWNTHWTRAMENMLDFPHLPFVHTGTIGKSMRKPAEHGRMDMIFDERDFGYESRMRINGKDEPGALDYHFPNIMVLHIPMPWRTLKLCIACVPIDHGRTRMIIVSMRNFLKLRPFDWIFRAINHRVASEDKPILETSWPVAVPPPGQEQSVRLDKPTLYFRRLYRERIMSTSDPRPAPTKAAS
jgi:phenylpropionate dioxygenase-like ring-hydroxylating dioxygenase large terminal subunit